GNPRRVARDNRIGRHIVSYHCSRAYHRPGSNRQAWQNRGVGSDRRALPDPSTRQFLLMLLAAWKRIVGERSVRPDEHIIFDIDAVPELHSALDRHPIAEDDIILNKSVVADVTFASN